MPHILYVEDYEDTATLMKIFFRREGLEVTQVPTLEEAWELAQNGTYDLLLLDQIFERPDGLTLCQRFRVRFPNIPLVIYTSFNYEQNHELSLQAKADAYFMKPYDPIGLIEELKRIIAAKSNRT